MEASSQPAPGDYVWEVPGKPVSVHIDLDVVDRIAAEVMRGFGAVPKRGAEVGGVLIGTIEPGDPAIVRVEDYEPVRCDYKRGPSYLFTAEDRAEFEDACERWMPDATRPAYAVGYFRSQTRGNPTGGNPSNQALPLAPEDVELMDRHFPAPEHVALIVKPYGTKVSVGGFFAREDGVFPEAARAGRRGGTSAAHINGSRTAPPGPRATRGAGTEPKRSRTGPRAGIRGDAAFEIANPRHVDSVVVRVFAVRLGPGLPGGPVARLA